MENNEKPSNPLVYPKNSYVLQQEDEGYYQTEDDLGITLRDYFAAKVLQGKMSTEFIGYSSDEDIAKDCYKLADEMLKQRKN